jgi:RND superfamily putative drug exporter
LIIFFVFFSFVPMGYGTIKPIALGLAVGIAFDAFVVRMTLVPALMALFKKTSWWLPKFLDRSIPHADVEGEKLRDHIRDVEWAAHSSHAVVVAEYLVPEGQHHRASPISIEWSAGERIDLVADPKRARIFAATLSGYLPHHSGALHVQGHPLPSERSVVKTLVSQWSKPDVLSLQTLGELLHERLAWSALWSKASQTCLTRIVPKFGDLDWILAEFHESSQHDANLIGTSPALVTFGGWSFHSHNDFQCSVHYDASGNQCAIMHMKPRMYAFTCCGNLGLHNSCFILESVV